MSYDGSKRDMTLLRGGPEGSARHAEGCRGHYEYVGTPRAATPRPAPPRIIWSEHGEDSVRSAAPPAR